MNRKLVTFSRQLFLLFVMSMLSTTIFATSKVTKEVEQAYMTWCSAIATAKGNPDAIMQLYAPNAVLLATFSSTILTKPDELRAYFVDLTKKQDIKCSTDQLITQIYGNVAVNSGHYTFTYVEGGESKVIPARFTFVYEQRHHHWLIVNHHSSVVPG